MQKLLDWFLFCLPILVSGFRMTVIPSLFDELNRNESRDNAAWIRDKLIHQKFNISVARYQRHSKDKPNFVRNQARRRMYLFLSIQIS